MNKVKLDVGATARFLFVSAKIDIVPRPYKVMDESKADQVIQMLAGIGVIDGATPATGVRVFVTKRLT